MDERADIWAGQRASLLDLCARAQDGSLVPLGGHHTYDAELARSYRASAVLLLFAPPAEAASSDGSQAAASRGGAGARPDLFLVQRSRALRNHPGEVALPGGRLEPGEDAVAGALREAHEEIGLHPDHVEVLGELTPLLMPHSRFVVTPVLGWTHRADEATEVEPGEVLHTLRVSVSTLVDRDTRCTVTFAGRRSPGFHLDDGIVWGMTANLLDHVLDELGWAGEWDAGREVALRRDTDGVWVPDR
ncbi:hypothetical protein GCM10023169_06280 [Georgenia halophila]|uniref:Nudix hydrolase domain-containing protein n=1 Tax=Georgenia halophila TaxID=620889 RepID=A0ABP8KWI4_9MICO